jgi:AraC family L-rhamnose operon transcriptional activator RhaR
MPNVVNKHLNWGRFFHDTNRVEANYVERHPDYPIHDHKFMELVVVVAGSCWHRSVLGECQISKGDAFLFRPGAWHAYSGCRDLSLYNCCFDPGILGHELSWMIDDALLGRLLWSIPLAPAQRGMVALHLPNSELVRCRRLLQELCALSDATSFSHRADQLGLLVQLLGALARQVPADITPPKTAKPHPAVTAALKLIDDNPAAALSLESLAARVHMEPAYLVRLFSSVAGLPPMAYLRRRRLELATTLLIRSHESVGEVGSLVGWPDANYFTRRFRAEFGLTPSAYRSRFAHAEANSQRAGPANPQRHRQNHRDAQAEPTPHNERNRSNPPSIRQ